VNELTWISSSRIFTGKITNWKDVGGPDARIIVYSRENSSGTYVFFKENVLGGADFTPRAQTMPGTGVVVNAVAKEKNGIGYGGAGYAKGIKIPKVKKDAGSPAIGPSLETVKSGAYALARPLFFYLRNKAAGDTKASSTGCWRRGQEIGSKVGYYPSKEINPASQGERPGAELSNDELGRPVTHEVSYLGMMNHETPRRYGLPVKPRTRRHVAATLDTRAAPRLRRRW
jgi:ABC-type phosphate transport system substrate-binding protein